MFYTQNKTQTGSGGGCLPWFGWWPHTKKLISCYPVVTGVLGNRTTPHDTVKVEDIFTEPRTWSKPREEVTGTNLQNWKEHWAASLYLSRRFLKVFLSSNIERLWEGFVKLKVSESPFSSPIFSCIWVLCLKRWVSQSLEPLCPIGLLLLLFSLFSLHSLR